MTNALLIRKYSKRNILLQDVINVPSKKMFVIKLHQDSYNIYLLSYFTKVQEV